VGERERERKTDKKRVRQRYSNLEAEQHADKKKERQRDRAIGRVIQKDKETSGMEWKRNTQTDKEASRDRVKRLDRQRNGSLTNFLNLYQLVVFLSLLGLGSKPRIF
jgi:hypothetical protein